MRHLRIVCTGLTALLVPMFLVGPAFAAPITFQVFGDVYDNGSPYSFPGVGKHFLATFTFDGDALDSRIVDPLTGLYDSPDAAPFGYTVHSGSFSVSAIDSVTERVSDGSTFACGPGPCDGYEWTAGEDNKKLFWVSLVSFVNLGIVTGDDLITTPPDLALFEAPGFIGPWFTYWEDPSIGGPDPFDTFHLLQGHITRITHIKRGVPEPSSIVLFGIALTVFLKRHSSRRMSD
jgi:hypothetical protein